MRQIKFRAWFIHEKEYRSWEDILSHRYNERWFIDNTDKEYINCIFTDDTIILEQYTGLKDKNGTEIYEGDIVKAYHYEHERTYMGYIIFENGNYQMAMLDQPESAKKHGYTQCIRYWKDGTHDWYSMEQYEQQNLEIIGNIHENPELMENK